MVIHKTIIFFCVVVFFLAGCTQKPVNPVPFTTSTNSEQISPEIPVQAPQKDTQGTVPKQVAFSSEATAQSYAKEGQAVYFFKANWCPTCLALQKELDSDLSSLPQGTTIVTVDYDNSSALKKKYAITYQHTLVQIDENGAELTKWQGGGIDVIRENLQLN